MMNTKSKSLNLWNSFMYRFEIHCRYIICILSCIQAVDTCCGIRIELRPDCAGVLHQPRKSGDNVQWKMLSV